eukprot:5151732-Prymnesium_polylepis.1
MRQPMCRPPDVPTRGRRPTRPRTCRDPQTNARADLGGLEWVWDSGSLDGANRNANCDGAKRTG